jgi:DNA-binding PucR family transcriptional regulator
MVLENTSRERVQALVDDALGPVLRYDAQHGAVLVATLDAYFAAGENPRAAARALQVHPNTVYQRLERVDQVLGCARWREPPAALSVQLALQLHRILGEVPFDVLVRP